MLAVVTSRIMEYIANPVLTPVAGVVPLVLAWGALQILDGSMHPLIMQAQGQLSDQLIHRINMSVLDKSMAIEDLSTAEGAVYYNEIQVIQDEVAWRPINLIIFSLSVLRSLVTVVSLFIGFAAIELWIAAILVVSLLPQAVLLYRLQQEAFENLVDRSPLSRRLRYYASVLLDKQFAKESRIFRYGAYFKQCYSDTFQMIFSRTNQLRHRKTFVSLLLFLFGGLGCAASFYYVVTQARHGVYDIGSVVLFASYLGIASHTLIMMIQESSLLYDTFLFMRKYFSFLDMPLRTLSGTEPIAPDGIRHIAFDDVCFTYPEATEPALSHVSFEIDRPQRVALVGENGSGKSTILKLLCRLYDADSGRITVNHRDIKEYDIASLRKQIGMVFQDFASYDLSLRDNIVISDIERASANGALERAVHPVGADAVRLCRFQTTGRTFCKSGLA